MLNFKFSENTILRFKFSRYKLKAKNPIHNYVANRVSFVNFRFHFLSILVYRRVVAKNKTIIVFAIKMFLVVQLLVVLKF